MASVGTARRTAPDPLGHSGPEAGSASIWLVALLMLAGCALLAVLGLGAAVAARHRAESAADLAALAAADRMLEDPAGACGTAARVASAQQARLTSCVLRSDAAQDSVQVSVEAPLPGRLFADLPPARGRARAGPLSTADLPSAPAPVPAARSAARTTTRTTTQNAALTAARSEAPPGAGSDGLRGGPGQQQGQQLDRPRLVQRVVAVAALGRLDAGRAAAFARTGGDRGEGGREPWTGPLVAAFGEARPARVRSVRGGRSSLVSPRISPVTRRRLR